MDKQKEAIIILNGLADNPLLNDTQKEAIMLGAESLQAKEDEWQTTAFRRGWKEGYGMGKQDAYKEMRKAEELKEKESASRR